MNPKLIITRYPSTQNRSLQAWNASDELILTYLKEHALKEKKMAIFNDRFGFLNCHLAKSKPFSIINYKSEEKALLQNLSANGIAFENSSMLNPLIDLPEFVEVGIIKTPKSTELFEFYLSAIAQKLSTDGIVICGFMTKYFNKSMLSVASMYFEEVEQSKAWKKARILVLKNPKPVNSSNTVQSFSFKHTLIGEVTLKQYPGVFSSNSIDQASLFFLDHLGVQGSEEHILDLASGNGILGLAASTLNPEAEIHFIDDSFLAIESSKLNVNSAKSKFHWNDDLEQFEDSFFDLVISNPPFHFEFETNIEVSIHLFKQVHRCLKIGGRFRSVASKHLNFKTHLDPLFTTTQIIAETSKFVVYESVK